MRFSLATLTVASLLVSNTPAFALPQPATDVQDLQTRQEAEELETRDSGLFADYSKLWRRKGGGGGGGKGGGSSSSGSSSSGSSSSSSGSSSSSSSGKGGSSSSSSGYVASSSPKESGSSSGSGSGGGRSSTGYDSSISYGDSISVSSGGNRAGDSWWQAVVGGGAAGAAAGAYAGHNSEGCGSCNSRSSANSHHSSSSKGSSSSNAGGSTKTGSGVTPNYGGGRYYGGGATTPYTSGARSPLGIAPLFLGVGLLSIYPGIWLYGAYSYPYYHPYTFHNRTANSTNSTTTKRDGYDVIMIRQSDEGVNQTKPVTCLCALYSECGCDDDNSTTFLDSVIGDGSYAGLNQSLITVSDVNGTSTILLNGTLPNGTTASGGTDDAFSGTARAMVEASGYWVMIALVGATVYFA